MVDKDNKTICTYNVSNINISDATYEEESL